MFNQSKGLKVVLGLFLFSAIGCATYQSRLAPVRADLVAGQYQKALETIKAPALEESKDQLAYLLDYASALQIAGQIQESNRSFIKADKLADQLDYHSISNVTSSLLMSEEFVQYKGDTFEKVFINAYLAMNFLSLGDLDSAMVEARRINDKYQKYRADEKKQYELNPFSKYLSAIIWEADKRYDDAYIAYNEAYKISANIVGIEEDLIRSAKLSRRDDAYKQWKTKFPYVKENPQWYDRKRGEVIILVQQGWGPEKVQNPQSASLPMFRSVPSLTSKVRLNIEGSSQQLTSRVIYNVERAAVETLIEDQGILIAKRAAALATKLVVSDQIRQKNELLGAVSQIGMLLSERADLRQWSLMPQTIQMIRVSLPAGKHEIHLEGLSGSMTQTGETLMKTIEVRSDQKNFVVWRTLK